MDVAIRQVGQRDGQDRFILVDVRTRKVVTQNDASARAIERFFRKRGVSDALIQRCLEQARQQYQQTESAARPPVDEAAQTIEDDNLLFELGLEGDEP